MNELTKIESYFHEGKRLWSVNPELVVSRQFFEMWEQTQEPAPFAVDGDSLMVHDACVALVEDVERAAFFTWDADEMCAALVIEGKGSEQRVLLAFQDGDPVVLEQSPTFVEDTEAGFGERLEVMYDVIAHMRDSGGGGDVLSLSKRDYSAAVRTLSEWHEPRTIRVMKRLPLRFVRRLLGKALEDMAVDEVSEQLSLPLGGSYAFAPQLGAAREHAELGAVTAASGSCRIPSQTPWAIAAELRFLSDACRLAVESETAFVLPLSDAEELGTTSSGAAALCVPADAEMPLSEGDTLRVLRRGVEDVLGDFTVDVFDGSAVYGRLTWADPLHPETIGGRLYAKPLASPTRHVASAIEALRTEAASGAEFASVALKSVMGLTGFSVLVGSGAGAPEWLDSSQARAWHSAVDPDNTLALVQGPPGTGKTCVLEQVLRTLCEQGKRILVTAPSNTAVDNICRRVLDLAVLRFGGQRERVAADVADACWFQDRVGFGRFADRREACGGGSIYAGTHIGLLWSDMVRRDLARQGAFDVIVFDEAGMTRLDEFLLCVQMADRAVLFGDHLQLPPFPLPGCVLSELRTCLDAVPRGLWALVNRSALQWLAEERHVPVTLLRHSYRCQNPRLMRFASTLFYDARVKASETAEYFRLPYQERQRRYPASSLRLYRTGLLPAGVRSERLVLEGQKPGLDNPLEACVCLHVFEELVQRHPLDEITIIAPYRRQVRLLRRALDRFRKTTDESAWAGAALTDEQWRQFLRRRVATVDSFQGGESDAVVISYVRSNAGRGIGFVGDPNRVNVAHTRCRREMIIVGDIGNLKTQARTRIFHRMERAFVRDGEAVDVTETLLDEWGLDLEAVGALTAPGAGVVWNTTQL